RAAVIGERGLVPLHAAAATAGQYEAVQRSFDWFDARVHLRLKSCLPPVFSTSCTASIRMSCDSALHMSYTVSAATDAPVSASISTPVLCLTATRQRITTVALARAAPSSSMVTSQCSIANG